jgi:hypothetical protein
VIEGLNGNESMSGLCLSRWLHEHSLFVCVIITLHIFFLNDVGSTSL